MANKKPSAKRIALLLIGLALAACHPDPPVATIDPGSSSEPSFRVQVIRPRLGLPLGGILPPQLFGLEAHLGFDSTRAGANARFTPGRLELRADGWDLVLGLRNDTDNGDGGDRRATAETRVVFALIFEDRLRKIRCRPDHPVIGAFHTTVLARPGERSGTFNVELPHCEDAETGASLGWPPRPLVLRGSFDRLLLDPLLRDNGTSPH